MKLTFIYPSDLTQFDTIVTSAAYEAIWKADGDKIQQAFKKNTGLEFQQDEIKVVIHDGQSMSGTLEKPMQLNIQNRSLEKRRLALIHELGHRLLSGNNIGAEGEEGDTAFIEEEHKRLYLFLGDSIADLYGQELYDEWANTDSEDISSEHLIPLKYALSFSRPERREKLKYLITTDTLG